MYDMKTIQARIDVATQKALIRLRRRTGLSDSQLVRKGLHLVAQAIGSEKVGRIRGVGAFASDKRDLGSNKRHLAGFGRR